MADALDSPKVSGEALRARAMEYGIEAVTARYLSAMKLKA
jgi:hypothetical protein